MYRIAALVVGLLCFGAVHTDAWIYVDMSVIANASLTKVADNTYDFNYSLSWDRVIPPSAFPQPGSDPGSGFTWFYYPYVQPSSHVEGHIGVPLDLTGSGYGSYESYFIPAPQGSFRFSGAPGVLALGAFQDIAVEYYTAEGYFAGRDLVGTMQGGTNLYGTIPTGIGETTEWAATPEPASWMLLGSCLSVLSLVKIGTGLRKRFVPPSDLAS